MARILRLLVALIRGAGGALQVEHLHPREDKKDSLLPKAQLGLLCIPQELVQQRHEERTMLVVGLGDDIEQVTLVGDDARLLVKAESLNAWWAGDTN